MNMRTHERKHCAKHGQSFFTECLRCMLEALRDKERPAHYTDPEAGKQLWIQRDRPETLEHPVDQEEYREDELASLRTLWRIGAILAIGLVSAVVFNQWWIQR